jgi:hypothetical protein
VAVPSWTVRGVRSMVMVMVLIAVSLKKFVVNRDTSMKTLFA